MARGRPVDGFVLEYGRAASGPAVVLLHGRPRARADQCDVARTAARPRRRHRPQLRGFGDSDRHDRPPAEAYSADAQADTICGLIDELGLERPVLAGRQAAPAGARLRRRRRTTTPTARP
jgi:pimeloyl-ACP methyl ester carboxylesterase